MGPSVPVASPLSAVSFHYEADGGRAARIRVAPTVPSTKISGGVRVQLVADKVTGLGSSGRLIVHWALGHDGSTSWHPSPYGWKTEPEEAWDAGQNAWQSPFQRKDPSTPLTFQLDLPEDAHRHFDAMVFTIKMDDHWLKSRDSGSASLRRTETMEPGLSAETLVPDDSNSHLVVRRKSWDDNKLLVTHGGLGCSGQWHGEVCFEAVNELVEKESNAERSLMHRYKIAADILQHNLNAEQYLVAVYTWLLFAWDRKLVWNRNYNVKPKEIAEAASKVWFLVCHRLQQPEPPIEALRLILRVCLKGAGGRDSGQEIRDQILTIQSKHNCKGGMMEEFHQKIHNNSSPDDIVICEALIHFIDAGQNIDVYWSHLADNGITKERLESYDRAIRSIPSFDDSSISGLRHDLVAYLVTLNRVHSSQDLTSAAQLLFGFTRESHKVSRTSPVSAITEFEGIPDLKTLFKVAGSVDMPFISAMKAVVEARRILKNSFPRVGAERASDVIAADLALDSRGRTLIESNVSALGKSTEPEDLLQILRLALENACLSTGHNVELVQALKQLRMVKPEVESCDWALRSFAALERARNYLTTLAGCYQDCITPTASVMASHFDLEFTEDISETVLRSSGLTALSLLLTAAARCLRCHADLGDWEIVAPLPSANTVGILRLVPNFEEIEGCSWGEKVVACCDHLYGDEDIPLGVSVIVTKSSVDVLSHLAVRSRNDGVALVTCYDDGQYEALTQMSPCKVTVTCLGGELQIEKAIV